MDVATTRIRSEPERRALTEVALPAYSIRRLQSFVSPAGWTGLDRAGREAKELLAGRVVWCVNSSPAGGGVAELLRSLLPYVLGTGVEVRWLVVRGSEPFFRATKRLHNLLHGHPGDGGPLGPAERRIYEATMRAGAAELLETVRPGDVAVLHDPQSAGLAPALERAGALVVWRCHVGADAPSPLSAVAWEFLLPYLHDMAAFVFSPFACVPPELPPERVFTIAPAIDPCSAKNRPLPPRAGRELLCGAGLGRLCPDARTPGIVLHLSRWDRLKDPVGVMEAFAAETLRSVDARLVLAGPPVSHAPDDPEAPGVYAEVLRRWARLGEAAQRRIDVVRLPLTSLENNALIVNALQRQAAVVVKKSLHEGFGLGVTEAMWKGLPVVATRRGGVREQIRHGSSGVLLDDPSDLATFGAAIALVLLDPAFGHELGRAARERVRARFLPDRHLAEWHGVVAAVVPAGGGRRRLGGAPRSPARRRQAA